jgi:hypothetical protein
MVGSPLHTSGYLLVEIRPTATADEGSAQPEMDYGEQRSFQCTPASHTWE